MQDGSESAQAHDKKRAIASRRTATVTIALVIALAIGATVAVLVLHRPSNPLADNFRAPQQAVDFPLYYPSAMPSYYFIENGSVQVNDNTVIFPIIRNDGQKITVTEQKLPNNFDLTKITGTKANIDGLGKVIIGTGFQGYRAVIAADKTLIFVSSSDQITVADFSAIVKSFRAV